MSISHPEDLAHEHHFTAYIVRSNIASNKRAAVLVLLYEKDGVLRVLLTTRAKTLRTHPGQTAFPGGKMDASDVDIFDTAVSASLLDAACAC